MKTPGAYIDGFLLPVPTANLEAYREVAQQAAAIWLEHGALQYTECVGDDLGSEFCRSFIDTAAATKDEMVIFSWAVFADREARDAANAKIMADERLNAMCSVSQQLFDSKRMAFGGFRTLVAE